jgi:hypothetical protein
MKKLSVALMMAMVMFFAIGCTAFQEHVQIQIDQESQEVIARIAGRHAGVELAKEYPNIAEKVVFVCRDIIKEESLDIIVTLTKSMAELLADEYIADPLKADIKDILSMIKVKTEAEITKEWLAITKAVAEGLISGIETEHTKKELDVE